MLSQSFDRHARGRQSGFFADVAVVQPRDGIHASKRGGRALGETKRG